jgi:hypothetical protein
MERSILQSTGDVSNGNKIETTIIVTDKIVSSLHHDARVLY